MIFSGAFEDGGGAEPELIDEGVHIGELATLHLFAGVDSEWMKNRVASLSMHYVRRGNVILDV